jgi:nucleolin
MNEKDIDGRVIHVELARPKADRSIDRVRGGRRPAQSSEQASSSIENDTRIIYIGNLSVSVSKDYLEKEFSRFGEVTDCLLPLRNGKPKGFAFVTYSQPKNAVVAIAEMNEKDIDGRVIHVELARPKADRLRVIR